MTEEREQEPRLSLWQVAVSVAAAFFGVQKDRNRERDFTHGRPSQFIIIGLVGALLMVLLLVGLVAVVMRIAGG